MRGATAKKIVCVKYFVDWMDLSKQEMTLIGGNWL